MDDVLAVLDAAGSERARACSPLYEGGPMAMLFAATAPERVGSLALYATFAAHDLGARLRVGLAQDERARSAWPPGATGATGGADRAHFAAATPTTGAWSRGSARSSARDGPELRAPSVRRVNGGLDVRPLLRDHPRADAGPAPPRGRRDRRRATPSTCRARSRTPSSVRLEGSDSLPFVGDARRRSSARSRSSSPARGRRGARPRPRRPSCSPTSAVDRARRGARRRPLARRCSSSTTPLSAPGRAPPRPARSRASGTASWRTFDGPRAAIRAPPGASPRTSRASAWTSARGLHTGECEVIGDDVGGLAVHIAARVMAQRRAARGAGRPARCRTSWSARAWPSTTAASTSCTACPAPGASGRSAA